MRQALTLAPPPCGWSYAGLDGEIPETCAQHEPGAHWHQLRPGVRVPRWPTHYLTREVDFVRDLWRLHREQAIPPTRAPSLLWPPPLLEAFRLLDREAAHAAQVTHGG